MNTNRGVLENRNAVAWLLMMIAGTIHVFNEATTGFLPFYNQLVLEMRERLGLFPMPTFSFELWLGGLIAATIAGFALTFIVNRGGRFIRAIMIVLGVIMTGNALGHMIGSLFVGWLLPGFWSSPFLLVTAVYVVYRGIRFNKAR